MELPSVDSIRHVVFVLLTVLFYAYFVTVFTTYLVRFIVREVLAARQDIRDFKAELQERRMRKAQREITK